MTIEPSLAQDLNHYRTAARALPVAALGDLLADKRQFIACRPFRCSELEDARLAGRRVLLESWQWGRPGANEDKRHLQLYEIKVVDASRTGP
jgi:hypothetical protein